MLNFCSHIKGTRERTQCRVALRQAQLPYCVLAVRLGSLVVAGQHRLPPSLCGCGTDTHSHYWVLIDID